MIKCRVRDPETKEIVAHEEIRDNAWCYRRINYFSDKWMLGVYGPGIREQFTNLTDKNGVEIYEGDVIAYRYAKGSEPYRDLQGKIYREYNGAWTFDTPSGTVYLPTFVREIEVIGSIHDKQEDKE